MQFIDIRAWQLTLLPGCSSYDTTWMGRSNRSVFHTDSCKRTSYVQRAVSCRCVSFECALTVNSLASTASPPCPPPPPTHPPTPTPTHPENAHPRLELSPRSSSHTCTHQHPPSHLAHVIRGHQSVACAAPNQARHRMSVCLAVLLQVSALRVPK